MTWVQINERLLEMEKMTVKDEKWIEEWNLLLSTKIAGILKREKYEVPATEKGRKEGTKEEGQRKDVATVSGNLERQTPLQRSILDSTRTGDTINLLSSHPAKVKI